jgi:hypothetical protein
MPRTAAHKMALKGLTASRIPPALRHRAFGALWHSPDMIAVATSNSSKQPADRHGLWPRMLTMLIATNPKQVGPDFYRAAPSRFSRLALVSRLCARVSRGVSVNQ